MPTYTTGFYRYVWPQYAWGKTPVIPVPPTILTTSADVSGGAGGVDWAVGTNVACTGFIDYGPTTAYGTTAAFTSGTGLAGSLLRLSKVLTPSTTYHYRVRVTGVSSPNNVETVGPDRTLTTLA